MSLLSFDELLKFAVLAHPVLSHPIFSSLTNTIFVAHNTPTIRTVCNIAAPTHRTARNHRRIIRPLLPKVYVYDHCPFCVRVRLALGIKNVKHTLHFLANDDVATPTNLVGKKIAPIFVSMWSFIIFFFGADSDLSRPLTTQTIRAMPT